MTSLFITLQTSDEFDGDIQTTERLYVVISFKLLTVTDVKFLLHWTVKLCGMVVQFSVQSVSIALR